MLPKKLPVYHSRNMEVPNVYVKQIDPDTLAAERLLGYRRANSQVQH